MIEVAADFGSYALAVGMLAFYWMLLRFWPDLQKIDENEKAEDKFPATFARTTLDPIPMPVFGGVFDTIRAHDRCFDEAIFLGHARNVYEMVLDAFVNGETLTLRQLVGTEVFKVFHRAIAERRQRQEVLRVMLVGIKEAQIVAAEVDGDAAEISVRFVAEMVRSTSAADGSIVEGSPEKVIETHDLWTFSRKLPSNDPCWRLIGSDEG
jgi:predicted lipid-binding transport protein (Tim44 family)